jgi:hypothetical protein
LPSVSCPPDDDDIEGSNLRVACVRAVSATNLLRGFNSVAGERSGSNTEAVNLSGNNVVIKGSIYLNFFGLIAESLGYRSTRPPNTGLGTHYVDPI